MRSAPSRTPARPPGTRGGGGRRPGRPDHRAGPGPPRPARGGAGRRLPAVDRLARHLLLQAHAGNLGPPGRGPAHDRQGRVLERRQGLLPRAGSLALRPAARARPPPPGLHQPAAVLRRGLLYEQARAEPNIDLRWKTRSPAWNRTPAAWLSASRRPKALHAARRLADRLRRRALAGAQADRPGKPRPHLPRPLPDRRREDEGRFPGRALVLVRPALPPQSVRAAAHAAGQRLAHRLPAGLERRSVEAVKPENVLPRIRALLGPDTQFDLEWVSVYTFACERMDAFRHGRVVFAGDSAHRVRPSARGPTAACRTPRTWPGNSSW